MCVGSILKNIEKQNEDLSSYRTEIKAITNTWYKLFWSVEIYVFDRDDHLKHTNCG